MSDLAVRTLSDCEAVIERGLGTFVEVGQALLDIRDSRLYGESHGTFEDYCRERWGMSRRHANRTIEAADVAGVLGPIGPTPPTEAVARELAPLRSEPTRMAEAWAEATENAKAEDRPVTAKDVRRAVKPEPTEPPALTAVREEHDQTDVIHHLAAVNHRMAVLQITRGALLDQLRELPRREAERYRAAIQHDLALLQDLDNELGAHLGGRLEAVK